MEFAQPRRRRDEEHILPLVNVVFLLLIFFMLAGSLTSTDPVAVEPPHSSAEDSPAPRDLTISLGADEALALDGRIIERDALGSVLAERLAGDEAGTVWLKADGAADALAVLAVMEELCAAGVERVQLLTTPAIEGDGG